MEEYGRHRRGGQKDMYKYFKNIEINKIWVTEWSTMPSVRRGDSVSILAKGKTFLKKESSLEQYIACQI